MDINHTARAYVIVIVIGASPAGLAAARALAREGRSIAVMEHAAAVASAWRDHRLGLRLESAIGTNKCCAKYCDRLMDQPMLERLSRDCGPL